MRKNQRENGTGICSFQLGKRGQVESGVEDGD
jgi:hypothetical protein